MNLKESSTDVKTVDKWLMRNPVVTVSEYLLPERDALTSQWGKSEAGILIKWLARVTQWQEEGHTEEEDDGNNVMAACITAEHNVWPWAGCDWETKP